MYIKQVVLRNIKGFEQASLDLCPHGVDYPGWAVITGDNGAGKSALLRAIALAILGPEQSRTLVPDLRGWVSEGATSGTISVEIKPNHDFDRTRRGGTPTQNTFWAEVELDASTELPTISPTDVFRKRKLGAANGPWSESTGGWFTVAYGPFRRLYGISPEAQRLMMIPGRIPRFATLYKEDATLGEGEEWLKDLEYKRLEKRPLEAAALKNLLDVVNDHFLRHGATVEEVNSEGVWLIDAAGRRIALSDMSEGYRAALAMLIDLFRHMVNVYGPDVVEVNPENGQHFVARPGVVLIDEVDAHLHPDWQREIGFWLREHFPQVQFIVTTHSPLVCPAANGGRIYHLPQPGDGRPFLLWTEDYQRIIAGKPDEILLTPAFGLEHTRSPLAVEKRERHAALASKRLSSDGLTDQEADELDQLALFATLE